MKGKRVYKVIFGGLAILLILGGVSIFFLDDILRVRVNHTRETLVVNREVIEENRKRPSHISKDISSTSSLRVLRSTLSASPSVIGVVSVPEANVRQPILNDLTDESLNLGAGVNYSGMEMGRGNFVLAGHFSYLGDGFLFAGLYYHLKDKGKISYAYLTDYESVYRYKVTTYRVVNEENTKYIQEDYRGEGGSSLLTLYTCNYVPENGRVVLQGELDEVSKVEDFDESHFNSLFTLK